MSKQQIVLLAGASVLAFVLIVGAGTYPKWGMIIRQSGKRQ